MSAVKFSRIKFNISGEIFETFEKTMQRYPDTLLGDFKKRGSFYCHQRNEYFFDRNRLSFAAILYFYQSNGILSCPSEIRVEDFEEECIFFELPLDVIKRMKFKEGVMFEEDEEEEDENSEIFQDERFMCLFQRKAWDLLENPETSACARYFALFSLSIIAVSIVVSCLETMPNLNQHHDHGAIKSNPWSLIELILNTWFLFELMIRFVFSPNKKKFCTSFLNCIDALAIIPYFILLIVASESVKSVKMLRMLRLLRVFRLFRLSKHSKRVKVVGDIIRSSLHDLQILIVCLLMLMVFGGSLMYFMEDREVFTSIPESLWWAVQTITTLGYGDITPTSSAGKLFAACFMAFGALTISLPVLSIVTKFTSYYATNL